MRAVAIIQARFGSSRLPGKVMLPIGGKTMLERVCDQVAQIHGLNDWAVVAPDTPMDRAALTPMKELAFGPLDPLSRYGWAAERLSADIIMRITADCPLLDARVATDLLAEFRAFPSVGYLSNVRPERLHPDGCDVEVFSRSMLEHRVGGPQSEEELEHVTLKMPARWVPALEPSGADLRWTVDTESDLEFVREVYRGLGNRPVSIDNVLAVTPGDACEHCAKGTEHLERSGIMVYELHQIPVWNGRIFIACEAWELAKYGGTRRIVD